MLHLKHKCAPVSRLKTFWDSLDESAIVNKRELFLGLTTCVLSGLVVGMLISPKKNMTIGSHNGCYNTGSPTASSGGDSKDEEASESEE